MPKRNHKVLPLNEKILDLIKKQRISYTKVAKTHGPNESSISKSVKKEKETHDSFAVTLQTAKAMTTVFAKQFTKLEKSFQECVLEKSQYT